MPSELAKKWAEKYFDITDARSLPELIDEAVAAERERIAKMVEGYGSESQPYKLPMLRNLAARIREGK